eukprot:1123961-Alexandrium_andersonii.AAC.1
MSASLVGSEMCIRDRIQETRIPGSTQYWIEDYNFVLFGGNEKKEYAGVAVSYTHLTLPTICSV